MTDGERASQWLRDIAAASTTADGVTRQPWTPEHKRALSVISTWMKDAGLSVEMDAAGTLCGKSDNPEAKPVLFVGSHQDSVPSGGAYDGIMGVALGCLAARNLKGRIADYPFALEVLAFADEEGVRFPTALIGPRGLAGTFDPATLDMRDADGVTMRDAMTAFGVDPAGIPAIARRKQDVLGYIEAHIEQGPVLETRDLPIAAVSAICGISRHEIHLSGETGHAGTVPMAGRRDALVTAARIIAAVNDAANGVADLRATVGQISVRPGAVNAIPCDVRFPLEIRSPDDCVREAFEMQVTEMAKQVSAMSGVGIEANRTYLQVAATCDPLLTEALNDATRDIGFEAISIPSGATHDASAMIDLCPIAMLFVRCRNGVSHRPDEFASAKDMTAAAAVLSGAIGKLAGDRM